jgi:hypothetical protein
MSILVSVVGEVPLDLVDQELEKKWQSRVADRSKQGASRVGHYCVNHWFGSASRAQVRGSVT